MRGLQRTPRLAAAGNANSDGSSSSSSDAGGSKSSAAPSHARANAEQHEPEVSWRPGQSAGLRSIAAPDVDEELWGLLELCGDDDLEMVYDALHASSPLSPVIKSLTAESGPSLLASRGREAVMRKTEARFRYLAADSLSILRGTRPSYRSALMALRGVLGVQCSDALATTDLETEIFMHVADNYVDYVRGNEPLDPAEAAAAASPMAPPPAVDGESDGKGSGRRTGMRWIERMAAPFVLGAQELLPTAAKLGGAVTLQAAGTRAAGAIGSKLVASRLSSQAAASLAARGLVSARGAVLAGTVRASALRGALSMLGPLLWGAFAADLAFKSIGTDHARVVRAVFILAQVRLLRTYGWSTPDQQAYDAAGRYGRPPCGCAHGDDEDCYDPGAAFHCDFVFRQSSLGNLRECMQAGSLFAAAAAALDLL